MKKTFRILLVLLLLAVLFRGQLYRLVVDYRLVDYRAVVVEDDDRLQELSDSLYQSSNNLESFVSNVQSYTAGQLVFRAKNSGRSARQILAGGEANCVGYARVTTDLIRRNIGEYKGATVRQGVAKISLLGFDLHQLSSSPFWKDHDVVELTRAGETVLVIDPSLRDYVGIGRVE